MQNGPIFQRLPCALSEAEKALRADELAREVKRHGEIELAKKAAAEAHAKELKESDRRIGELAEQVRTGVEPREVECQEVVRFARNLVETIRLDTGEVVSSRAMRPEERQEAIDFGDEAGDAEDLKSRTH